MLLLYNLAIRFYQLAIATAAATGNKKAKLWIAGRKNVFPKIQAALKPQQHRAWFHFASLGEFEQGRPVLEAFKKAYPDCAIFITFFSPSGYEIRKNYEQADYLFYLPLDTASNAQQFVDLVNPDVVFFTKYEYWHHYFKALKDRKIPLYIISAIFRENQLFFKVYGAFYRQILTAVTYFFVQNEQSEALLKSIHLTNVLISGDTRFDRVAAIRRNSQPLAFIDSFLDGRLVLVAGSTWPEDEALLANLINQYDIQLIIAPHEINAQQIAAFRNRLTKKSMVLSEGTPTPVDVLIIDRIGLLSQVYQYAHIAYIGGGFGKGIHNTLEAAVWGIPVLFGPHFQKFAEAKGLIEAAAAYSIQDYNTLATQFQRLVANESIRIESGKAAEAFIAQHEKATEKIIQHLAKTL